MGNSRGTGATFGGYTTKVDDTLLVCRPGPKTMLCLSVPRCSPGLHATGNFFVRYAHKMVWSLVSAQGTN